jgi:natural product precursor
MKKLSKIKLQDAVVLENREMKTIFGGSGGACDPYAIN